MPLVQVQSQLGFAVESTHSTEGLAPIVTLAFLMHHQRMQSRTPLPHVYELRMESGVPRLRGMEPTGCGAM